MNLRLRGGYRPARCSRSAWLGAVAAACTSTSSGPGTGVEDSPKRNPPGYPMVDQDGMHHPFCVSERRASR